MFRTLLQAKLYRVRAAHADMADQPTADESRADEPSRLRAERVAC
jgi:hypothetical protein